jgi:hypothetical protein
MTPTADESIARREQAAVLTVSSPFPGPGTGPPGPIIAALPVRPAARGP